MSIISSNQNQAQKNSITKDVTNAQDIKSQKIHEAAKGFVSVYLSQFAEQLLATSDIGDEHSVENEFFGSMLSEGLGKKLADSQSADHLVRNVENKMRRQIGLENKMTELQSSTQNANQSANQNVGQSKHYNPAKATNAYQQMMTREASHVSATAA